MEEKEKHMKKTMRLLLFSVLILSLTVGCNGEKESDANEGQVDTPTEEVVTEGTALTTSTGEAAPDYSETLITDVLLLGGGGAGITSTLTSSENGKKVILTEKIGFLGGATIISGGILPAANTKQQQEVGIDRG